MGKSYVAEIACPECGQKTNITIGDGWTLDRIFTRGCWGVSDADLLMKSNCQHCTRTIVIGLTKVRG